MHRRADHCETGGEPILLLFTLGARRESRRRQLLPSQLQQYETEFRDSLLQHVASIASGAGCELVISSPDPLPFRGRWIRQDGDGFGERLASSIDAAWDGDAGQPLIVVGSDTPGMTERHVATALRALADDPKAVVIGPSLDGGMYLIGAAAPLGSLAGVRWCTPHARRDLIALLLRAGRTIVRLEALGDLDTTRDLQRWLSKRIEVAALQHISSLLRSRLRELTLASAGVPLHHPAVATRLSASVRPPPAVG